MGSAGLRKQRVLVTYVLLCWWSEVQGGVEDAAGKARYLPRYLFYDVNPWEGFNLRRDVYVRLAVVASSLREAGWNLVLPPWYRLQHWTSPPPTPVPWSAFFDVHSMRRYAPVLEMYQVFQEIKLDSLDATIVLQHFKEAFTDSWSWEEKWELEECGDETVDSLHYWAYPNITSKDVFCVSFQGQASAIKQILDSVDRRLVKLDRAEVVLHDAFGTAEYWRCRRSMRFAPHLVEAAASFRRESLDSTDGCDATPRPPRWEDERPHRTAVGGHYLAVHLRRRDFEVSRKDEIPTLDQAARQISAQLRLLNLTKVFIATDAPSMFVKALSHKLLGFQVLRYPATSDNKRLFKDGGLAIIDQIICSHARHFLGTYESTFSFRIQEEREILGFPEESTFNRLCGSVDPCSQPTRWLISH